MKTPEVTIVIPVRNEEYTIAGVLRSLGRQDRISECQVIVVDGESTDATADIAARFPFVEVLRCPPGRSEQLNFGAAHAAAPVVWFLHSDSTLPEPYCIDLLLESMQDPDVVGGAFRFHLRGDDGYFRVVTGVVNLRARLLLRPYGDQGIFVRTQAFRELGGFRRLSSSEDLDLVLRLRKLGRFRILRAKVETSARTWQRYGKVRTTWWHLREWISYEWRNKFGKVRELPPSEHEATLDGKQSEPAVPEEQKKPPEQKAAAPSAETAA
jgi:uncharacterized protein